MGTRSHVHEEVFAASQEELFALLVTPTAIQDWWSASRALVLDEPGGYWAASWGDDPDAPDYVTFARVAECDPPRRLVLTDYRYRAKAGALPFEADFVTSFEVSADPEGARLRVTQDGFPAGPEADEFYAGCRQGWTDTFAGIRRFLDARGS